ncbi:MAG: hypothetical protein WCI43_07380 [Candidatus Firestonebacteria bacterium]
MDFEKSCRQFNGFFRKGESLSRLRRIFAAVCLQAKGGVFCRFAAGRAVFITRGRKLAPLFLSEDTRGKTQTQTLSIKADALKDISALNHFLKGLKRKAPSVFDDFGELLSDERTRRSKGLYYTSGKLSDFAAFYIKTLLGEKLLERADFYDPAAGTGNLLVSQKHFGRLFASEINTENLKILKARGLAAEKGSLDFLGAPVNIFPDFRSPLFVVMNPPFRGKTTNFRGQIGKKRGVSKESGLSPDLVELLEAEKIRSRDLCSFFILKTALLFKERRLKGYLGLFSPTNWLTPGRGEHDAFRKYIFREFSFLGGFIVNGKEFFHGINSGLPVAFSVFSYGGGTRKDPVFADLTDRANEIKKADSDKERAEALAGAGRAVIAGKLRVCFRDYFRAINAQTGDDRTRLFELAVKGKTAAVPRKAFSAGKEYYLAGTDKGSGYAVAVKPAKKKSSGCQFCLKRELPGPALAWHYLWDYQQTFPARFYNAVPVSRKYAYTFVDGAPLLSLRAITESKAVRRDFSGKSGPLSYAKKWLSYAGDFRGLWFFFYALSVSKTPLKVSKYPGLRNMPVRCPDLNAGTAPFVREAVALGFLLAKERCAEKFKVFSLIHKGVIIAETEAFFNRGSSWSRKAALEKYLFIGINNDILKCRDKKELLGRIDIIMKRLYPEGGK